MENDFIGPTINKLNYETSIQNLDKFDIDIPDFKIGDKVTCIFPDRGVYPIDLGKTYTITNMRYDMKWGWEYEIENFSDKIFDCYEFSAYLVKEIKWDKLNEKDLEKIKKFIQLTSFVTIEECENRWRGYKIFFDEKRFNNSNFVLDEDFSENMKKLNKLINILNIIPEYLEKELEDIWQFL